jgi:hypothetical protein
MGAVAAFAFLLFRFIFFPLGAHHIYGFDFVAYPLFSYTLCYWSISESGVINYWRIATFYAFTAWAYLTPSPFSYHIVSAVIAILAFFPAYVARTGQSWLVVGKKICAKLEKFNN